MILIALQKTKTYRPRDIYCIAARIGFLDLSLTVYSWCGAITEDEVVQVQPDVLGVVQLPNGQEADVCQACREKARF